MSPGYDAIVVGAGHNGLVAALTLAAAKRRVLVVERSAAIGGLCAAHEFSPGYRVPGLLPDTASFRSELIDELGLEQFGLELRTAEPPAFVPLEGGGRLLHSDPESMSAGGLPEDDALAYAEWRRFLASIRPFVRRLLDSPPPRLDLTSTADLRQLASAGWALRRLGRDTTTEFARLMPMCVADWLRECFQSEALAAALAAPALLASFNGPWAAGSAANLIFRESAADRSVVGGPAALVAALEAACRHKEVEIRAGSPVGRIRVESGQVAGVTLTSGEEIDAPLVLTTCHPKTALIDLVGAPYIEASTEWDLANFRSRGTTAVMLLAVEGSVEVAGFVGHPIERLRLGATSFDGLERAFDAAKYGRYSTLPYLEIWIPSIESPDLAPSGGHVVAALVSCAPYGLKEGWSTPTREALIQTAVHQINEHLPGVRDRLAGGRLLAPPDLEESHALPGGHLHHGEPTLDQQLFLRPSLRLSRYATDIDGLYLGGSGSHPGGGVTGVPGRLAANAALGR